MSYVYIKSEKKLYTVGFFQNGIWRPESDHDTAGSAANRVHWLNGGMSSDADITLGEIAKAAITYRQIHGYG